MRLSGLYILSFLPSLLAIHSGASVAYTQFPFFATLILQNTGATSTWLCGGSLLNSSVVVTAAHCTRSAAVAHIYLNASVMLSPYSPGPSISSTQIYTNPSYSTTNFYHDIGFVVIPSPSTITPLKIGTSSLISNLKACQLLSVVGRGYSCNGGCLPNNLQYAELPLVPISSCVGPDYSSQWTSAIVGSDLCLGYEGVCKNATLASEETCSGDSGGPLFDGNQVQYGVVSRGSSKGCGLGTNPSIFSSFGDPINYAFVTSFVAATNYSGFATAQSTQSSAGGRWHCFFLVLLPFLVAITSEKM